MSGAHGQAPAGRTGARARPTAPRLAARVLDALGRGLGLAAGLLLTAALVLTVRLGAAPLEVTRLTRLIARQQPSARQLTLTRATLWWNLHAVDAPLVLTITGIKLPRADGSVQVQARQLTVDLPPAPLLVGRPRPLAITVRGAGIALLRGPDGTIGLDGGAGAPAPLGSPQILGRLRTLDVADIDATLRDPTLGAMVRAHAAALRVRDIGAATLRGSLTATLALGDQATQLAATLSRSAGGGQLDGQWSGFVPARLGLPADAPTAVLDTALSGQFHLRLDHDARPQTATATLTAGPGAIVIKGGRLPILRGAAVLAVDLTARQAQLTGGRLMLDEAGTSAGPDGISGSASPVLAGTAMLAWGDQVSGTAALDLDHLSAPSLARYWPPALAPHARTWITTNITAGRASEGHIAFAFVAAEGDIRLTAAQGRLQVQDVTLSWLRPVPPLVHGMASLTLLSPDLLDVTVRGASQTRSDAGSAPIMLTDGNVRISGLSTKSQSAVIAGNLAGPVAQVLALLREPRLHLLDRHKIDVGVPGGTLAGHLQVSLPFEKITADRIGVRGTGQVSALHLGGLIAGKDLDRGAFALQAGNDGLSLVGTADLAGIPSSLAVTMDFRPGPPGQTVTTYKAAGTATVAQLQQAGLPAGGIAEGGVTYATAVVEHRDGSGQADVHVDLRAAALALPQLGWRKLPNADSKADAVLLLDHDRIVGLRNLSVSGPGVDVQGQASYEAGRPVALTLAHVELGATRATGELRFPTDQDRFLRLDLHGPMLDLASRMAPDPERHTPGRAEARAAARRRADADPTAASGQPWRASLQFDRVGLGPRRTLTDVSAHAEHDGRVMRRADVAGRAGTGRFHASLVPRGTGRALDGGAEDAGGLLRALDLTQAVQGGSLSLNGTFDDTRPDHRLTGTVQIDTFKVAGAPAVARLLQAVTVYGVVDALGGPDLGFSHLVAPFRYADAVLTLDGARAFSGSLGFTAKGDIDLAAQRADLTGTIVPAYFFNTLLGRLPVLGKLFSPEQGGGVLSATYSLTGPLATPKVHVNPLAALTPGVLRGLFGLLGAP